MTRTQRTSSRYAKSQERARLNRTLAIIGLIFLAIIAIGLVAYAVSVVP